MSQVAKDSAGQVQELVAKITAGTRIVDDAADIALDCLERYECWTPYFQLLDRLRADKKHRKVSYYVRQARSQNLFLEDVFAASQTIAESVEQMKLDFETLHNQILPVVIAFEDWRTEAVILQEAVDKFTETKDKVRCMERLCLLYEKKVHNEDRLSEAYERLLRFDPYNIKALRYFKMAFSQNGAWPDVANVLKKLLQCSTHEQDIYRVAQELAAVLLYQLDQPKLAIDIIEAHCSKSPLDTSMIHYDAYLRLNDLQGCLRVLHTCLERVLEDERKAVIHFKIGQIYEKQNKPDRASAAYEAAVALNTNLLEPFERLTALGIAQEDWQAVDNHLQKMRGVVYDKNLSRRLDEACIRLRQGYIKN